MAEEIHKPLSMFSKSVLTGMNIILIIERCHVKIMVPELKPKKTAEGCDLNDKPRLHGHLHNHTLLDLNSRPWHNRYSWLQQLEYIKDDIIMRCFKYADYRCRAMWANKV